MSMITLFAAAMLACLAIAGGVMWRRLRIRASQGLQTLTGASTRKLSPEERAEVEHYLAALASAHQNIPPSGSSPASVPLTLCTESSNVICVSRAITRYGLSTDAPHKWRYYLDALEVHLPPFWEPYITSDNQVELIPTSGMPLVISLNGHTLPEYRNRSETLELEHSNGLSASMRGEESEQIELLNIRQESREEYALSRPNGLREAFLIVAAMALFFLCLVGPDIILPWLLGGAIALLAAGVWGLVASPAKNTLREIHCLHGTPKRWDLFGESDKDEVNNISLGIIDLLYPRHWQPFIVHDLGHKTDIDIYLDRHVVRQGKFLSLRDEVKNFPLQYWLRSLVIACGALLVLIMLIIWAPLDMPLKMTLSWLKGAQTVTATSVSQLEKVHLRVGDTLRVNGNGTCRIHMGVSYTFRQTSPFMPFDCSQIIWNTARPMPLPESDIVDKAMALSDTVNMQLHPQNHADSKVNPQLATAIQKSGMVLLDNFADIVQKTQALCIGKEDCARLKKALVNLGSKDDWDSLTRSARSGRLSGINVLMRPSSAELLDTLVNSATRQFFMDETLRAAKSLDSPAPGGFVIISDEGTDLVDQPLPPMALYDYPPPEQWREFRRLAEILMNTPFNAEGVITSIQLDANGTHHITMHSIPDSMSLWRYAGTSLLLLALIITLLYNALMAVKRYRLSNRRLTAIQQYYEHCFNPQLLPPAEPPAGL